jgi:hypothetical protein
MTVDPDSSTFWSYQFHIRILKWIFKNWGGGMGCTDLVQDRDR